MRAKLVTNPSNSENILKQKFLLFLDSLVDLILEAIYVAVFILFTYGISLLIKHTIREKWNEMGDFIIHGTLIVVSALGALQFIGTTAIKTYKKLKTELTDELDRND